VCKRAKAGDGDGENHAAGPCKLEPVYFDFNDFDLAGDSAAQAERDAECLKKAGDRRVDLVGHTDPRGTEEYNLALSDRRAQAVRQYLQRLGINPTRLRPVPKGELEASGTDESGWVKDRRVDVQW
jgi:peptidoglycan-associated lipoprotein